MNFRRKREIATLGVVVATVALLSASSLTASAIGHPDHELPAAGDGPASNGAGIGRNNPTGSNGTIKIDGFRFDGHPNNDPHIQNCFEVDFYGFDEGDVASLTFRAWPGTGDGAPLLQIDGIQIGFDGAGGGIDIDQQLNSVQLRLLGSGHPRHGHHVRADATITSADGRTYTKTKVFWVHDSCDDSGSYT